MHSIVSFLEMLDVVTEPNLLILLQMLVAIHQMLDVVIEPNLI